MQNGSLTKLGLAFVAAGGKAGEMSEPEKTSANEPIAPRLRLWRAALAPMELAGLETLLRLGAPLESALAICVAIRAESAGHSFAYLQDFASQIALLREGEEPLRWPETSIWLAALHSCPLSANAGEVPGPVTRELYAQHGKALVFGRQADGRVRLYLHRLWFSELDLAGRLLRHVRVARPLYPLPEAALALGVDGALRALQQRHLFMLTGGPGTGKTTAAARLLLAASVAWQAQQGYLPHIRLCAPTGKAAARLYEAFSAQLAVLRLEFPELAPQLAHLQSAQSQTLHRVLGYQAGRFSHDADQPLECDLLLVDEASMLSLPMMHALFRALTPRQQLILLGDAQQLTAVESGTPFADFIDAAENGALGPTVLRLNRQWRAEAELFELAQAIRARQAQRSPVLAKLLWRAPTDWDVLANTPEQAQSERAKLQSLFLSEQVTHGHWDSLMRAPDLASAWRHINDQRVLCALHEGPAGQLHANAVIERELRQRFALKFGAQFRGRLVMATRNDYRIGVMNGDVGLCWPDASGRLMFWFERAAAAEGATSDERTVLVDDKTLSAFAPERLPEAVSAFALTVHKAQGSEFARVALLLPSQDSPVLHRALLYTAITRAKSALSICAPEEIVHTALQRELVRSGGLRDFLLPERD